MTIVTALAIFLLVIGSSSASLGGYLALTMLMPSETPAAYKLSGLNLPDFQAASGVISKIASGIPECAGSHSADCNYLNFRPAKTELQGVASTIGQLGERLNQLVDKTQNQLDTIAPQFMELKSVAYGVIIWAIISGISLLASGTSILVISRRMERGQSNKQTVSQSRTGAA